MTSNHAKLASPLTWGATRTFNRRTMLAGSAALALAGALVMPSANALAQATPSNGHNPFPASTPAAASAGPAGLLALLECVPDTMLNRGDGSGVHWYYADIAQQFAALGLHHDERGPAMNDDPWVLGTYALATGSNAFQYALVTDFTDAIGFQPLGVNQTLLVGDPPNQLTLFRRPFDLERLEAAWEATGYLREAATNGATVWTIGKEGEFEITHPVQRVVIAAFNNLALLGDDILACAPTMELLEEAIATFESGDGSAAQDPVLGLTLSTLPDTTVSAVAATPSLFGPPRVQTAEEQEAIDALLDESDADVGSMPEIDGMIVAVNAGAATADFFEDQSMTPPDGAGLAMIRLVTISPEDAEQAIEVVEHRWNSMSSLYTQQPFIELMAIESTSVDGNIAEIDFIQLRSPKVWLDLVIMQDLLPFQK